jgi:hypothetical protein
MVPVAEKHDDERREHDDANKRVQDTRQLWCPHDLHQPVEGREEEPSPLIAASMKQKAVTQWLMRSGAV